MFMYGWFISTDRASTIPKNPVLRLLDRERSEGHSQSFNESIKITRDRAAKKKETEQKNKWLGRTQRRAENPLLHGAYMLACNTKRGTRQEVFGILLATSLAMPPPDGKYLAFAPKGITLTRLNPQGSQASLSTQSTPFWGSFGRYNQRGYITSLATYGRPKSNLNIVHLFYLSLPLPVFGHFSLSPHPRGY